jgi:probable addiction module antidote protein
MVVEMPEWTCLAATNHLRPQISEKPGSLGENTWRKRNMARCTKDWNKGLAEDLRNPEFAREFLLAAIEEGIPLQHAIGKVVRATGVKEFGAKVGMESPNLLRAIHPRHNPTQATINRILSPLGLKLSLAPIQKSKRSHA